MTELAKKRLAFLQGSIDHFNSNNRGVVDGKCSYEAGCAIGRHLNKPVCVRLDKMKYNTVMNPDVFTCLPPEMQDLGKHFLKDVQRVHDYVNNWNETGLTDCGRTQIIIIKEKYNLVD